MKIVSNKEVSFGAMVDAGKSKDEIMKLRDMTEKEYDKALASLLKVREDAAKGMLPKQQKERYRHTGMKWGT